MRWNVLIVLNRGTKLRHDTLAYGALRANLELAKYLQDHQCCVSFVCDVHGGISEYHGIPVCACDSTSTHSIRETVKKQGSLDLILENSNIEIFSEVLAPRQVVLMHNPHHPWGVETLGKALYQQVSAVVCVSEHSRRMNHQWGVPESKLHVVPNGLDASIFNMKTLGKRHLHRLVFIGQLMPDKGFDIAIRVLGNLRQIYPELELHAYGRNGVWKKHHTWFAENGLLLDDGYLDLDKLEQAVPGLRLCGEVNQDHLVVALRKATILLHPSRLAETFGLVSIEAQACGCLPVLPNQGAFPETLPPGYAEALIAQPDQIDSFTEKVRALLECPEADLTERRELLSRSAIERFSWHGSGSRALSIFTNLKPLSFGDRARFQILSLAKRFKHALAS